MESREMTLEEWCKKLPKHHLVNKQLKELKEKILTPPHKDCFYFGGIGCMNRRFNPVRKDNKNA